MGKWGKRKVREIKWNQVARNSSGSNEDRWGLRRQPETISYRKSGDGGCIHRWDTNKNKAVLEVNRRHQEQMAVECLFLPRVWLIVYAFFHLLSPAHSLCSLIVHFVECNVKLGQLNTYSFVKQLPLNQLLNTWVCLCNL